MARCGWPGAGGPGAGGRADQPAEAAAFGELSDPFGELSDPFDELSDPFDEDVLAELELPDAGAAGSLPDPDELLAFFSLSLDAVFPLEEERLSVR